MGKGGILLLPSSIAASSCLRLHSKEKGEEKGGENSTLCSSEAAAVSSPHAVHPMSFHAGGPFGALAPMHRWVQENNIYSVTLNSIVYVVHEKQL